METSYESLEWGYENYDQMVANNYGFIKSKGNIPKALISKDP